MNIKICLKCLGEEQDSEWKIRCMLDSNDDGHFRLDTPNHYCKGIFLSSNEMKNFVENEHYNGDRKIVELLDVANDCPYRTEHLIGDWNKKL